MRPGLFSEKRKDETRFSAVFGRKGWMPAPTGAQERALQGPFCTVPHSGSRDVFRDPFGRPPRKDLAGHGQVPLLSKGFWPRAARTCQNGVKTPAGNVARGRATFILSRLPR